MTTPNTPNDPIADDLAALKAAIDAGPTPGEWAACGPSFGDPFPRWLSEVIAPDDEEGGQTVAHSTEGAAEDGSADMAYIAAANPARIARLIAALEAARVDAERYRWLAGHCRSTPEHWGGRWSIVIQGPAPIRCDCEDAFDAAIDSARGAA